MSTCTLESNCTDVVSKKIVWPFFKIKRNTKYVKRVRSITKSHSLKGSKYETKKFFASTSVMGPGHIIRSKGKLKLFWIIIFILCTSFFILQSTFLIAMFLSKPTFSKISIIFEEEGLPFPSITFCNFNPIRYSYVNKLNKTGTFSKELLDYISMSLIEVTDLMNLADYRDLVKGQKELEKYINSTHKSFSINNFIFNAGFDCEDMLRICSLGGQEFDCCSAARPILTKNGKCYEIDLKSSYIKWLHNSVRLGVDNGLMIIADYHSEEQLFIDTDIAKESLFGDIFQKGFRYSMHEKKAGSPFASEDSTASPGTRVFTALKLEFNKLLESNDWGNCTKTWPSKYKDNREYSSRNCKTLCRAKYFNEFCGCAPYSYNIDDKYANKNSLDDIIPQPLCEECAPDCESWIYSAYNSYGGNFPSEALYKLAGRNNSWTPNFINNNFVAVNIFFKDNSYTFYEEVKATTISEVLSNIGGSMGLFLGMNIISVGEIYIYILRIFWICVSKRRRKNVIEKKRRTNSQITI
ncbi:Na+ channel, amiloride-sensitive family-containing protein [Strongyloides ratti]|uniref:Na+ channel, amiloride-sensitive family-containing protein n=1 Tax=Strongyloides ratti TaxID=34506 RepID=A0A090L706_STRRB|nr:Na+ channel, amiloride-sensitive family-containing protein [Strongyloides ratti]CEF65522.1 Na+ channel, amiloride-sensitive family-containing protein [Strongyloides ratti]